MPMIERSNAAALIPEPVVREIISGVRKQSVAMQLLRKLPNMTSGTQKQPVLSMLPSADFVNGDAGMKITTNAGWDKKVLVVGEIAAIVPIPDAVVDDADYDIWGEVRPLLEEQMARVFDNQVFMGGNQKAPAEWPQGIIPAAVAKGNVVTAGTGVDIAADVSGAMALLEDNAYDVSGIAAQRGLKARLRDLRDNNGSPIFTPMTSDAPSTIYGVNSHFVGKGTWTAAEALAVLGDWSMGVYSIRQDMTFKIFDTGVISDEDGAIVYNLLQQDMKAMRAVMRLAWQIADPIDIDRPLNSSYPFAVLKPSA